MRALKKFSVFLGRLPLAGKFAVRPNLYSVYNSRDRIERRLSYVAAVLLLATFIFGHMMQLWSGSVAMSSEAPLWFRASALGYALVNGLVVIVHAYWIGRTTEFFLGSRTYARVKRQPRPFGCGDVSLSLVVTISGNLLFTYLKHLYA